MNTPTGSKAMKWLKMSPTQLKLQVWSRGKVHWGSTDDMSSDTLSIFLMERRRTRHSEVVAVNNKKHKKMMICAVPCSPTTEIHAVSRSYRIHVPKIWAMDDVILLSKDKETWRRSPGTLTWSVRARYDWLTRAVWAVWVGPPEVPRHSETDVWMCCTCLLGLSGRTRKMHNEGEQKQVILPKKDP